MRFLPAAAVLTVFFSALSGAGEPVSGQRYIPLGGTGPALHLEVVKPFVSGDGPFDGAKFATSGWDATATYPLGSGPTLFARMGLMYASIEGLDGSLAITNPRVGVMLGSATGTRRGELHVDLPLATDFGETYATGIGIFSNYEEQERFLADTWAVGASGSSEAEAGPGAFVGTRAGGTVVVPADGSTDVYASLALYGHAPTDQTRFRIEFSSLYLLTREGIDFTERTTFFASLHVNWPSARFSPTLYVRAPIDETLDATVPFVAGARLSIGS